MIVSGGFEEREVVLGDFRGVVEAALHEPRFLASLSGPDKLLRSGHVFHAGRNRLAAIRLRLPPGRTLEAVLKEFRPRGVDRLKTLFLPSKALRAWRGATALLRRGIPTPAPLAFLERRRAGMMVEGYYLAERVDGGREARDEFRRLKGKELDRFLLRLAEFLRLCHERGVLHRDLSDGNILSVEDGRGGRTFYLLDTNRIRAGGRVRGLRAAANLVRLGVPQLSRTAFLSFYHAGRPVPGSFVRWYRFRKAWYSSIVKLKKALRLKKLSRKLGVQ